jgi:hypothetical protein
MKTGGLRNRSDLSAVEVGEFEIGNRQSPGMADNGTVLPYRTAGEDLERFCSACNRGRDMDQIQSLFPSSRNFSGTTSAAATLGLYKPEEEVLTSSGEVLATGEPDKKKEALFQAVLEFEPYELLLEAIFTSGVKEKEESKFTPLKWVEKWWEDNGYGSSQTNRDEGSTTFANISSYLELGSYKQGRHGHPSRIEWDPNAEKRVDKARERLQRNEISESEKKAVGNKEPVEDEEDLVGGEKSEIESPPENNSLTLNLSDGRVAKLSLPPKLSSGEKERLVSIVELMVETEGGEGNQQMEMDL